MLVMTDDLDSSPFSHQTKKGGGMGGNGTVVIRDPGSLVKTGFMQSKRALCTTNQGNLHTCKTSQKFSHNFIYKYMKYSNKARRDNCITDLTTQ